MRGHDLHLVHDRVAEPVRAVDTGKVLGPCEALLHARRHGYVSAPGHHDRPEGGCGVDCACP
eukprot:2948532-Lingulodinium_polyedra.AAC.1